MTVETKVELKAYFETGDRPTQTQFANLIDSAVRDAMKAIADAAENDGFTGILDIKSSTSVTSVNTGTYGLRLLATETTAEVAAEISESLSLGSLCTLSTGANNLSIVVSGGNFKTKRINGQNLLLTAQSTGDMFVAVHSTSMSKLSTSAVGTFLYSNGVEELPSYEPITFTTSLGLSGASVAVDGLPTWGKKYNISYRNESGSTTHDVLMSLGNASAYISAGYAGYLHSLGVVTRLLDGAFNLGAAYSSTTEAEGSFELVNLDSNVWGINGIAGASDSALICFGVGNVDCSAQLTRLRFLPSAGTFDLGRIYIKGTR